MCSSFDAFSVVNCTSQRALVATSIITVSTFFSFLVFKTVVEHFITSVLRFPEFVYTVTSAHCYLISIFCLFLLVGVDVGSRWKELYHLWESHTDDHILVRALILLRMRFNFLQFYSLPLLGRHATLRLHTNGCLWELSHGLLSHGQNYLLPPFSLVLIRDFENKTLANTFPKLPSVLRVIDISDRNPPITARFHDVGKVRRSH